MITGTILASATVVEALSFWLTCRTWQKRVSRLTVRPEELTPENRARAQQALLSHYITSPWP